MNVILFIQKKLNNVKLAIRGDILEYSNRHASFRIDKSNHTKIEWTCGGYRVCFGDGSRKTCNLPLLSKKERAEVDSFFNNVRNDFCSYQKSVMRQRHEPVNEKR